jgi:hypothetical protein
MSDATVWTTAIQSIAPVIGALGGYWLSGHNDEKRDERALAREEAARHATRAERLADQQHEFELQTFVDLQNELVHLAAFASQIVMFDRRTQGQRAGKTVLLPDELNGGFTDKVRVVQLLQSRILDHELRAAVVAFIAVCASAAENYSARTPEQLLADTDRAIQEIAIRYQPLVDRIGEHLRTEVDRLGKVSAPTNQAGRVL